MLNGKLSFGKSVVMSGVKSSVINAGPQLTVTTTEGGFIITPAVSKALNIAPGERIAFTNNFDSIAAGIQARMPELVEWCDENGVDIDSKEGQDAIFAAFGEWSICKGWALYDRMGEPSMVNVRVAKKDKEAFLAVPENRMKLVEENREALIEEFGELSDEELAEKLTADMVPSPQVQDAYGCKTAASSSATTAGATLTFTDTNIWMQLKADLTADEKAQMKKVYDVVLDEVEEMEVSNGFEKITVKAYPIKFVETVNGARSNKD